MKHLRLLKLANFALGAYTFIFGSLFFVMFVLPGWMARSDGEPMGWVFILSGLLVFLLLGGLGLAHVVAGYLVSAGRGRGAADGARDHADLVLSSGHGVRLLCAVHVLAERRSVSRFRLQLEAVRLLSRRR